MEYSKFSDRLMAGNFNVILYNIDNLIGKSIFEELMIEGKRLEKIFNFYDSNSELSRLNKNREIEASKELLEVIKKAIEFSKMSAGEYDITFGKNFLERKSNKELSKLSCSYKDIEIISNKVILRNKDVMVDLGSIAKGYIVDKLIEFLKNNGVISGLIDARGDIRLFGESTEKIAVKHPREEKYITEVIIKDKSIATSGDYNQYYGSYKNCHILNKKELISVTVVSDELCVADVLASLIFVMNLKKREELILKNPKIKVLTIDEKLKLKRYNGFENLEIQEHGKK